MLRLALAAEQWAGGAYRSPHNLDFGLHPSHFEARKGFVSSKKYCSLQFYKNNFLFRGFNKSYETITQYNLKQQILSCTFENSTTKTGQSQRSKALLLGVMGGSDAYKSTIRPRH